DLGDPLFGVAAAPARAGEAPLVAVEAEAHHVHAPDAQPGVEAAPLGQVADLGVALARTAPEHGQRARRKRDETEHGFHERRLAGPVRAEHGDEGARMHREIEVLPDRTATHAHGCGAGFDGRPNIGTRAGGHLKSHSHLPVALARARCSPWSSSACQSWKDAVAGVSVSVTDATGMPTLLAKSTWAFTSGVEFWLLKT